MRRSGRLVHGSGRRLRLALGIAALLLLVVIATVAAASAPAPAERPAVLAAPTADPSAAASQPVATPLSTADLRSSGQGAGAAGNPMGAVWAFVVVIVAGTLLAGGTLAYVRVTDARRTSETAGDAGETDARDVEPGGTTDGR